LPDARKLHAGKGFTGEALKAAILSAMWERECWMTRREGGREKRGEEETTTRRKTWKEDGW